jgi:pimeloyl-ACP methyl ester carboxylesterase
LPIAKLKDVELYYDEFGSGDRYLISAQQFHSKIASYTIELANRHGFHVFNIQIRGYGKSSPVYEGYGDRWYNVWSRDVIDFADAMGIDKFFYTGVSHGAGIGWYLCHDYPERIRGFFSVVGGPHKKTPDEQTSPARMATIRAAQSKETWEQFVAERVKNMSSLSFSLSAENEEEYRLQQALHEENLEFWSTMTPEAGRIDPKKPFPECRTEEELIEKLKTIKVPTLMIGGIRDNIIFPEDLVRSCRAVEGSKLILYEDGTHGVAQEHRVEVANDIMQFCIHRNLL